MSIFRRKTVPANPPPTLAALRAIAEERVRAATAKVDALRTRLEAELAARELKEDGQ